MKKIYFLLLISILGLHGSTIKISAAEIPDIEQYREAAENSRFVIVENSQDYIIGEGYPFAFASSLTDETITYQELVESVNDILFIIYDKNHNPFAQMLITKYDEFYRFNSYVESVELPNFIRNNEITECVIVTEGREMYVVRDTPLGPAATPAAGRFFVDDYTEFTLETPAMLSDLIPAWVEVYENAVTPDIGALGGGDGSRSSKALNQVTPTRLADAKKDGKLPVILIPVLLAAGAAVISVLTFRMYHKKKPTPLR